ncbi:hypothetical protein [Nodularia spumigena]|uniref:hypothetical protein n=1 Tax=Nodularia spumigena TaxID=70799 RepID=UPI002B1F32E2|nr:hypothetical protein [Nodularia spumigena]MEA5559347.1 hypothetical protein [Nodularia spumigena CH309]
MISPSPPDLDSLLDSEETELNSETARYLAHIENKLYADIQVRKRIDAGLLFLACQFSSCSLSWLLFHLQISLSIIQVFSACLSLLPGLIDFGDSFRFSISSESWQFDLGQKPLIGIIKIAIGGVVSAKGTAKITHEVFTTQENIQNTYQQIRQRDGYGFQMPSVGLSLMIALLAIATLGLFKKVQSTGEKQDEI